MRYDRLLIELLARTIDQTLRAVVPTDRPCALVGFPDHSNVGDSAIWLGTLACLRRLGVRVGYACSIRDHVQEELIRCIGDGPILVTGGGNLGDLWRAHQDFLHHLLVTYPERQIIQLPQSMWFRDHEYLDRARKYVDGHPRFTLMLRDRLSLYYARECFAAPCLLCPDLALALGPLARPVEPHSEVYWLARGDLEAQRRPAPIATTVPRQDWIIVEPPPCQEFKARARWQLDRGCRLLSQARVVITDRLHGHILCVMLGIPHVVMDNSYGKLRNFLETWTAGGSLGLWASSPGEALWKARELLACPASIFENPVR